MTTLVEQLLTTDKSVKEFRGAVFEASRRFIPMSVADIVFRFYQEIQKYYADLLIHEFQLYSDRPKQLINLSGIFLYFKDDTTKAVIFDKGKGTDFSVLQKFNDYEIKDLDHFVLDFALSPELTNLKAQVDNTENSELFTKNREFSIGNYKGGGFMTSSFEINWSDVWEDNVFSVKSSEIKLDDENYVLKYFGSQGTYGYEF